MTPTESLKQTHLYHDLHLWECWQKNAAAITTSKQQSDRNLYKLNSNQLTFECMSCRTAANHTATHCNALQRTATHCNTLQHTATHRNTLQHAATQVEIVDMSKEELNDESCIMLAQMLLYNCPSLTSLDLRGSVCIYCSGLQCVVMGCVCICFSELRSVAMCCSVHIIVSHHNRLSPRWIYTAMYVSTVVRCNVLQHVAMCCSVRTIASHFVGSLQQYLHLLYWVTMCRGNVLRCVEVRFSVYILASPSRLSCFSLYLEI